MSNYNAITTYGDFVQYCLKRLGAPVINIEVADEQIIDRVTDALQYFLENHYESQEQFCWIHTTTAEDVENGYLQLSPEVLDVTDVLGDSKTESSFGADWAMDSPEFAFFQGMYNYGYSIYNSNMIYYEMQMQELSLIRNLLNARNSFSWRTREKRIYAIKPLKEGNLVGIVGYKMLDPETDECIWNSDWLKAYATALIGIQWGTNLTKFGNVASSGGININANELLARYQQEKRDLEENFKNRFQYPPMPMIG